MRIIHIVSVLICMLIIGCSAQNDAKQSTTAQADDSVKQMLFNADSAYQNVKNQVDFGPRIPGSEGHKKCADYLIKELSRYGADTVIEQRSVVTAFNGDKLPINNIMGQFNKNVSKRILLLAHWDTRPWADAEADRAKHSTPILGANDGGSGVGVLLEIARCLGLKKSTIGVDILFVDAEDYGASGEDSKYEDSWCLGTQYWVKNMPYNSNNVPMYGILLDMVGGRDARFHRDQVSMVYAQYIANRVWSVAINSGYGSSFVNAIGGSVIDDHYYINQAGIPCVDIIENLNPQTQSFNPTWHTLDDNMSNIDRNSLKAVGQTVLNLIYIEK